MNTTPALKRTRRHLITFFGLAALLLPVLLFVPPLVLPQGRPVPPPPRRDLPPGPLTPVRTISIDSSYLLCNSLQLQSARRVVWEPVLSSLGVTLRDRDVYALALDTGARKSELHGLTWADVDLAKRVAKLRDTKPPEQFVPILSEPSSPPVGVTVPEVWTTAPS